MNRNTSQERQSAHLPEFTEQELETAIGGLTKRTGCRHNGIEAEDLISCDETQEMMRGIFNEIIKQGSMSSELVERSDKSHLQEK